MVTRSLPGILMSLSLLLFAASVLGSPHPSYSTDVSVDTVPFYEGAAYDPNIPQPNQFLPHPIGNWPSVHAEVSAYLQELTASSDRMLCEDHGISHEGRRLFHLVISSPDNLSRLEELVSSMDRVADPRRLESGAELEETIADLPAFAWLAFTIHGDEISGTDAAIQLAYHLAAANDSATLHLLDEVVILLDPMENPDGRDRYLSMMQTYRSHMNTYDRKAMQKRGVWPRGRTNHYWFDLNRDWILLTQPETKGRVETVVKYHPVLAVDGHEMGTNATFLMSPPRQPINYNTPSNVLKWYDTFRYDQAAAFDQRGWPYYTGEWNDQWYVGYGSAWPTFFGTVGILYEQAGVDGGWVKQSDDYLLTYHEAVNHQFTSALANLFTTADNRVDLLRDYHNARRDIIEQGRKSGLTFLFAPEKDVNSQNKFVSSLLAQGIEVHRATGTFSVAAARDIYDTRHSNKAFPAGTYIVSTAQPHGALAKAILEFDLHLKKDFLEKERRELEKYGQTRMYEISAWSVPMAYDLDAYETTSRVDVALEPVETLPEPGGSLEQPNAQFGFVIDMVGEATYRILNRLFQERLIVHASEKAFTVEGKSFEAGALLLRRRGNPDSMPEILGRLATEERVSIIGVNTGLSTEGSHLGAPTFRTLRQPRIALVAGDPMDYTASGSLWFTIDREMEIPHTVISLNQILYGDISEYNVLVIPGPYGNVMAQRMGMMGKGKVTEWMQDGGTLVMMDNATIWACDTATGLSQMRLKRQALGDLEKYSTWLARELAAEAPEVDTLALYYPEKVPAEESTTEEGTPSGPGKITEEEDSWARRFFPRGVIMQARVDTTEWLAFGMKDRLPVPFYGSHALLSAPPVTTVMRLVAEETDLRISGLMWPEALRRWAGTAWLTREQMGKGQMILFASQPYFRAYWRGTWRPFMNAILYGPGFTASGSPYGQP